MMSSGVNKKEYKNSMTFEQIQEGLIDAITHQGNTQKQKAVKFDQGKPRLDLIPPEVVTALGHILAMGAEKYGDRNWELGMDWGRVFAAAQRHLWSWWDNKEKVDPESGRSHLEHALCCLAFLIAYEQRGIGTDTRVKPSEPMG